VCQSHSIHDKRWRYRRSRAEEGVSLRHVNPHSYNYNAMRYKQGRNYLLKCLFCLRLVFLIYFFIFPSQPYDSISILRGKCLTNIPLRKFGRFQRCRKRGYTPTGRALPISWYKEPCFGVTVAGFRGDGSSIFIRSSQHCFHWPAGRETSVTTQDSQLGSQPASQPIQTGQVQDTQIIVLLFLMGAVRRVLMIWGRQ